ncbi:cobalt-zinc-cadmium efflux system protein [Loktanella fryxellensis]|uniref:Cobalt-zinc-cadmium efflux system protein n=1 Tax=Loktanella fryxellensis TaxID=245187 RepID=A0A1H8A962_9RHOB|nr:cation diffusion facilitator family transporter [Loktanella fryxellensis]SEM66329.1 cobalt-zinc-cadmium efflux system protein [Loktanella fryxellensis]
MPHADHDAHAHAHGDQHGHSHAPTVSDANARKVLVSFCLIFAFMLVEVVGGLMSGSLALLADAGHMLTDAAALSLAYAAFVMGRRQADGRRTYGYLRFEVIAGFVNALSLFAIVGWILVEAVARLRDPGPVLAGPMMLVAVGGLIVNLVVLWIMTRGDTDHVNIRGAILHVAGDLLGSVGAIAAAVVILLTGWAPIDPILSVLVSLLILRSAWGLLASTLHILLEGAPHGADPAIITRHLLATVPDLAGVGHVHVWQITSGRTMATLRVRPRTDAAARAVARAVEAVLASTFGIEHPTVAIDWNDGPDGHCSLLGAQHDDAHAAALAGHRA